MNELARMVIALELKGDSFHAGVAKAQKDAENLANKAEGSANKIQSVFSRLGGFISRMFEVAGGNLISRGIEGIVNSLKNMGQEALTAYAEHERLGMALQSLVARELMASGAAGDMASAMAQAAPRAQELQDWITKLAIQSPFTEDQVAQTFRVAQAYGFTSKAAQRLTQVVIDFAAGSGAAGDSAERIATALGQIEAKGKLSGEEIKQLTEAGVAVWPILSKAFGKSAAQIQDMTEKGLIPADVAIKAIAESLERDFGGAAARQAISVEGLITSLDEVKKLDLRALFGGAIQALQPAWERFVSTLSSPQFLSALKDIGQKLGQVVGDIVDGLIGVEAKAKTWGYKIGESLAKGIQDAAVLVAEAVGFIGGTIRTLLEAHSPPKLLPDIDQWGTAAADAWLDGFRNADAAGAVSTMGDALEAAITDVQNRLSGISNHYADLMAPLNLELQQTQNQLADLDDASKSKGLTDLLAKGNLTADQRNRAALQLKEIGLQKQLRELQLQQMQEQIDLQKQLRDLQLQQAQARSGPGGETSAIDKALKGLGLQKDELSDLQRKAELRAVLDDKTATAAEKTAAQLELQEINLRQIQRAAEATKLGVDLSEIDKLPIVLKEKGTAGGAALGSGVADGLKDWGDTYDYLIGAQAAEARTHGVNVASNSLAGKFDALFDRIKEGFAQGGRDGAKFGTDLQTMFAGVKVQMDTIFQAPTAIEQWIARTDASIPQWMKDIVEWSFGHLNITNGLGTFPFIQPMPGSIWTQGNGWDNFGGPPGDIIEPGGIFGEGRANGGPVWPGKWLVGERGVEELTIGSNGRGFVRPLQPAAEGAGVTNNYFTFYVSSELDLEETAYRISQIQQRRRRR